MSEKKTPTLSWTCGANTATYNAIATLETLETLKPGDLLEVITDCSQSGERQSRGYQAPRL